MRTRLIFLVGGPDYHPVNEQAQVIIDWLGPDYACHIAESLAAFEHLAECDLLVLMGQHWTGWEGRYRPPSETHRRSFEKYVQSGRPILSAHGAIASYDDWSRFSDLVGFNLHWEDITPSPVGDHWVRIRPTNHPIVQGVSDFQIVDDLLPGVEINPGMRVQIHAEATWAGQKLPMVITGQGGRLLGSGKTAYLANGHDIRTMQSPELKQLWLNAAKWCLEK
jgi:type 1 glutamine amidotransferase